MKFHRFAERSQAAEALAQAIAQRLGGALEDKGRASFVASGGGSPRETYELLGRTSLDWQRVSVLPSDERCVGKDSPRHNLGMIQSALGVPASFAELTLETILDDLRPFDVVLLGMGGDGHTASLFPGDPNLLDALDGEGHTHPAEVPGLPEARISMTRAALLDAKAIFLLILGADKLRAFEAAKQPGPVSEYPVRILLHDPALPLEIYWAP